MDSPRISTGIIGLDGLLHGGYVRGRTYLMTGDTGTGKTIACLQFLSSALKRGEKAVYVTVDERPGEIVESAASFSWDLQPYIQEKSLVILDASPYFGGRSGGATEKGIDPQKIIADLGNYAKRLSATLLIVDPITPLILPNDATSPSQDQARSLIQLIQSTQYNQPAYRPSAERSLAQRRRHRAVSRFRSLSAQDRRDQRQVPAHYGDKKNARHTG